MYKDGGMLPSYFTLQNETLLLPAPQQHPKGSKRSSKMALGLVMTSPSETLIEEAHTIMEDLMRRLKGIHMKCATYLKFTILRCIWYLHRNCECSAKNSKFMLSQDFYNIIIKLGQNQLNTYFQKILPQYQLDWVKIVDFY